MPNGIESLYVSETLYTVAGSDNCLRDWQAGPYAKGPPTYMRDSFEHEHDVSPPFLVSPVLSIQAPHMFQQAIDRNHADMS